MRGTLAGVAVVLTVIGLAGCGGGGSEADPMGAAMCSDIRDGLNMLQLYKSVEDQYTNEEFAAHSAIWIGENCPTLATTNEGLTTFFTNWGYDPSNLLD